jgi:pyruvate/2-oxoglutarate/acetoin dehydrogenase E1 component
VATTQEAEQTSDRGGTRTMRYREALNEALREEMQRDESVFIMGEDIGVFNGAFKVTQGLLEEFGEKRVRDTPISENTIVGAGVGAAMIGLRPVVELMTVNFSLLAMDQIVNSAAHIRYMFGGQVSVPLVVRMPQGAGHRPARRRPGHAGGREGPAQGGDPRRQPGRLHRARVPLRPARRGARR